MRVCNQILKLGVNFHGWTLPLYSLYGSVDGTLYVCTNLFPRKDHWYNIKVWNGYRFVDETTEHFPAIRKAIKSYMTSDTFVRTKCVKCEHKTRAKKREFHASKRDLNSIMPHAKKPQTYVHGTDCYSQSCVDGKNYDLSMDERVYCEPFTVSGVPVEYRGSKPVATFSHFDGLLDDVQNDHMKIKQVKIRPEKDSAKRRVIISHNGVVKEVYTEKSVIPKNYMPVTTVKKLTPQEKAQKMTYEELLYHIGNLEPVSKESRIYKDELIERVLEESRRYL